MKKQIKVALKTAPYKITISKNIKDLTDALSGVNKSKKLFIISDSNVAKLYLKNFCFQISCAGFSVKSAVIPAGERGKNIEVLSRLYDKALKDGIDRKSCVLALGGGVVGDIAGFFAATYMRGIKFVQVPTTLLAMTDSCVGGKTAVNVSGGKNIAGAFYQPSFVWINSSYLSSLDQRQLKAGFAEIIKYAFIFDKNFYDYLLKLFKNAFIGEKDFEYIIYKSCFFKARVVEKDEFETKGLREVLNFGHTFAHALETYTQYKKYLHGEAVAVGMLFAAKLSFALKICPKETCVKVEELLNEAGLIFKLGALNVERLVNLMKKDKKSISSKLRFVLLKDIGKFQTGAGVSDAVVKSELCRFLN
ncbi:MAG: 3-dehydroquinate synthase [Endomicrobium sp.]|jgi:3-dehydroquinate synthase|nr:3-dehydroquinate synthase [Endomicrobium sp.]